MNNNPLISIIISYYKKKKYIKKTLNSILRQSYKNFELIFVYDQENKKDLKFIKNLLKKFKKTKLIINKKNIGVAKSRNLAIKFCRGKYISFIDADDIWLKNKLKVHLLFMQKNNSNISYTSYGIINDKDKLINLRKVSNLIYYEKLIKNCEIGLSTVMISRKIKNKVIFPNLKTQEDFALWLKLMRNGYKFYPLNKVLSYWRKADNSLSSSSIQKISDAFKLYYNLENKNFIYSIYSVIVLAYNKINKIL